MEAITICLKSKQIKELRKRAKAEDSNFSQQVRSAIDQYLENPAVTYNEEELKDLLAHSEKSSKNIILMLDETNATLKTAIFRIRSRLEKI